MFAARRITATSIAPAGLLTRSAAIACTKALPSVNILARKAFYTVDSNSNSITTKTNNNNNNNRMNSNNRAQLYKATVQRPAPLWSAPALVNGEITKLNLSDFKGKFVVMVFYPADFTFVCPTELIAFSDRIEEFKNLGAEVVGISVDNVHSHLAWTNVPRKQGGLGSINIPLVSDIHKRIASSYNVLIPKEGVALRGLFVIDPKGILRIATIHDLPIGRSVDETLRVIEAIQFTDEHGEVCPANWTKGEKAIKPDPKGSQEFFESTNE
ncbi:thioredoxin-like protein [Cokeromyces recurvatus]|uniref:thioredoxin-like protein n=1 Tax=Cokeromyces recurvatus TaxID=90255 RepID=UPI002220EF3C|nr:thioredoxin-like protein [Cokeromyces recurvatus]KAI7906222.1 thioredoxin-like protein [Cokeromyces recurvatus]